MQGLVAAVLHHLLFGKQQKKRGKIGPRVQKCQISPIYLLLQVSSRNTNSSPFFLPPPLLDFLALTNAFSQPQIMSLIFALKYHIGIDYCMCVVYNQNKYGSHSRITYIIQGHQSASKSFTFAETICQPQKQLYENFTCYKTA